VRAFLGRDIERKLHLAQDARDLGGRNRANDSSAFGAGDEGNLASFNRQQQPGASRVAELSVRQNVLGRLHEHPSLSITVDQCGELVEVLRLRVPMPGAANRRVY